MIEPAASGSIVHSFAAHSLPKIELPSNPPIHKPTLLLHVREEAMAQGALHELSILIVEHTPQRAVALVEAIDEAGGDSVYATNRHDAMQRLQNFTFDAAIIDGGDNKVLVNELMRLTVPIYLDDGETEPFAVVAGIRTLLSSTR
jgi:hypothetical protein